MTEIILFEKLKRRASSFRESRNSAGEPYFYLEFDARGRALLSVKDRHGGPLRDWDYRYYHGSVRHVLKALERAEDQDLFRVDWEASEGNFYLGAHEDVLWPLLRCERFVDRKGKPIPLREGRGEIWLHIAGEGSLSCRLMLSHEGETITGPRFLSESHVYAGGAVFEVRPVGELFQDLAFFETELPRDDLEKYLSLLFSHFEGVEPRYESYRVEEGEPKHALPSLLFEKVDRDGALSLRVCSTVAGLPPDFFNDYDLSSLAFLNELEKKIVRHDVILQSNDPPLKEVSRLLKKNRKAISAEPDCDFFRDENLFILERELAHRFVSHELGALLGKYAIYGAEHLKSYKVRALAPKLLVRMDHGIDFLEGEADLDFEGQTISLFDALLQYRKKGYVVLADGSHGVVNQAYMEKLERLFKKKKGKVRLSFFDLPIVEEWIQEKIDDHAFHRFRDVFKGFQDYEKDAVIPSRLQGELRPYQRKGLHWLRYLHKVSLGGCLADDMGLGKTIQTIAMFACIYPRESRPSLVVMPRTLLFNWAHELRRFAPHLKLFTYYGQQRDMQKAREYEIILTTYGLVRNDIEAFRKQAFSYLVLDESQHIKNPAAGVSKAVMLLNGEHRLALSGTPVENNLTELYSLFRFLNPGMFGGLEEFNRAYGLPIQKNHDKDAMNELRRKIAPFMLRRLKQEVLADLPPKVEQTLYVEMSPKQRTFYEQRRTFYRDAVREQVKTEGVGRSQFFILQALSELRQIASIPEVKSEDTIISPKRDMLVEQLLDVTANGHKVLVYANFLGVLDRLAEDLESHDIPFLIMTGATRDRRTLVNRFQSAPGAMVFLMTLKTGGVGLNLTAADYVFIFDPWWNRAAETQAVDRTHRIGQAKTVFTYRLITKDTIEEKIALLQEMKAELVDNILGGDGPSLKSLSESDLDFIFGGQS